MVHYTSDTPPLPTLSPADPPQLVKLRGAELAANNALTSLTLEPYNESDMAVARTKLQEAFMWAEKAITNPKG